MFHSVQVYVRPPTKVVVPLLCPASMSKVSRLSWKMLAYHESVRVLVQRRLSLVTMFPALR